MARKKTVTPVVEQATYKPRTPDEILAGVRKEIMREWRKALNVRRGYARTVVSRTASVLKMRSWSYECERIADDVLQLDYHNALVQIKRDIMRALLKAKTVDELVSAWEAKRVAHTDTLLGEIPYSGVSRLSSVISNIVKDNRLAAYREILGRFSDLHSTVLWAKNDYDAYMRVSASALEVNTL